VKNIFIIFGVLFTIIFTSCKDDDNVLTDAEQTAALKNVTFKYDSMQYILGFPEGALDGHTFAELMELDSSKYANPANYTIAFLLLMDADNTKSNSKDAKFDGMVADVIMDTIESTPVEMIAGPFEIMKNTKDTVIADGSINLATHRQTGLYIFRQVVDGNDLATTLAIKLNYKFGLFTGDIPLPEIHQDIPTRASEETKEFLRGLLESGVMELENSISE
jgi:hypothetical protein